ncbi:hypothetical protein JOC54_000224 [Alkalihalobacillus xiaoxiensis]|uniref:Stage III sporulation protein AH n=1 Tax=Shouchella xiaoxiensis TaxID=766895 RepID=A0ABS2SN94_9BACI|nr:stage III sporulation protein AH [Shouchella xiaoxiensis]MBM7836993.1 hypothetical protein [Shouchella xiaoxiensis]
MFDIVQEPKGEIYSELLDVLFEVSDRFELILRNDMLGKNKKKAIDSYELILAKLAPYLIEMNEKSEWASNRLVGGATAFVYEYKATEEAKLVIKQLSDSLYQWIMPKLPEDLSFYKNGRVVIAVSSHEEFATLFPDHTHNAERTLRKLNHIEGLLLER